MKKKYIIGVVAACIPIFIAIAFVRTPIGNYSIQEKYSNSGQLAARLLAEGYVVFPSDTEWHVKEGDIHLRNVGVGGEETARISTDDRAQSGEVKWGTIAIGHHAQVPIAVFYFFTEGDQAPMVKLTKLGPKEKPNLLSIEDFNEEKRLHVFFRHK